MFTWTEPFNGLDPITSYHLKFGPTYAEFTGNCNNLANPLLCNITFSTLNSTYGLNYGDPILA